MYKIEESTTEESKAVVQELINSNITKVPIMDNYQEFNYHIKDEAGTLIAGVVSSMMANWIGIKILWVHEDYRSEGLGSRLLKKVEKKAKENSCIYVQVDTFQFQAKSFYLKHGYEIFGEIPNTEFNLTQYYFTKKIK